MAFVGALAPLPLELASVDIFCNKKMNLCESNASKCQLVRGLNTMRSGYGGKDAG